MKYIQYTYFLILLFEFIYSQIEDLTLKDENFTINSLKENKKYKIILQSQPLFLQIIVEENKEFNRTNKNNYFISYYHQDSNLENRKQMSKSFQGKAIMWLNREQIKNNFYISIECENAPCDYSFNIIQKKLIELSLNEKYTYYVTEENKQNRFAIDIDPPNNLDMFLNNFVQIWVKGNKNVMTNLLGDKIVRFVNYNAYILNIQRKEHLKLILNIEAKVGDLITIGVILFENGISNMYLNSSLEEVIEIDTLVKKEIAEKTCYRMPTTELNIYDNLNYISERDIELNSHIINDNMICGQISSNLREDFYSIQYTLKGKIINYYNPIIFGPQYNAYIYEGESMAIIPLEPEEDYNFLNYYIFSMGINIDAYIYDCDAYPFCSFDKNNIDKYSPLEGYYNSYSYSLNKNEINNKLAPINKKQKVLVLTCLKGVEKRDNNYCIILINIYTDKSKIEFGQIFNQYRFTREGNEDNFIINKKLFKSSNEEHGYINIETISGDISVVTNDDKSKYYQKNNKKLYIVDKNIDDFSFKIRANKNSVYYLNYYGVRENNFGNKQFYAMNNGNYLFNINKDENLHLRIYTLPSESSTVEDYPTFTGFYPLECQVDNIQNNFENFTECYNSYLEPIQEKNGFYQYIYKGSEFKYGEFNQDGFYINKRGGNVSDVCLLSTSFYLLGNEKKVIGIILEENIPKKIYFNQKYNELNFTYPHVEKSKDINIHINLLNGGKYKIIIFIKEVKLEQEYDINENTSISLKPEMWKHICKDNNQLCRIFLDIKSEDIQNETFIEILINDKTIENK